MLGDEFHYLLEFKYFTEERKNIYQNSISGIQFQKLMSTEIEIVITTKKVCFYSAQ